MRFFFTSVLLFAIVTAPAYANRKLAQQYIAQYKDIAIAEMYRSGIPASIKLAQGLLESSWGMSDLATKANNHFGIKCGSNWEGQRFFKFDDDTDAEGNTIESCFRVFPSPFESYLAHSNFLTNPAKKSRYGFLFQYPTTDYVSWAKGLQFSGYASDQKYADKLINLIENYKLYEYDVLISSSATGTPVYAVLEPKAEPGKPITEQAVLETPDVLAKVEFNTSNPEAKTRKKYVNGLACIVAHAGQTIEEIAKKSRLNKHDIVIYNESKYYLDTPLKEGQVIFLESKKRFNEAYDFHLVKESESLFDIAQKYGIRTSSLASRNKIPEHARLTKGLKLYINQPGMDHSHLREELVSEEFIDFGNLK